MSNVEAIWFKKLDPSAVAPSRAKEGDAGYDLVAIDDGTVDADGFIQYRTGLSIDPPQGYHTEIWPRSSISKYDLALANSIGLVDNGYRGELLVRGASQLAVSLGVAPIVIGLTVVAFGTSTPELAVPLNAALSGNADISVSNVVGSNIFNVLFILGLSAIVRPLVVHSQMIAREVPIMIAASVLLALFSLGGSIQRWEGIVLFGAIIIYTTWLVIEAKKKKNENQELEKEFNQEFGGPKTQKKSLFSSIAFFAVGLGIIMLGADWLVEGSVS